MESLSSFDDGLLVHNMHRNDDLLIMGACNTRLCIIISYVEEFLIHIDKEKVLPAFVKIEPNRIKLYQSLLLIKHYQIKSVLRRLRLKIKLGVIGWIGELKL